MQCKLTALAILLLFAGSISAAPSARPDTAGIHKIYLDGDFDQAINLCESALRESMRGLKLTHSDSVFLFKHLGVMYSAKYETRELGKKYMYQLLHVEPTALIMDMYASDMIYMIFRNIKDEYDMQRARITKPVPSQDSKPLGKQPSEGRDTKGGRWVPWTIGTAAVAGGAVAAYLLLSGGENTTSNDNTVP
jgi:hypothetical protein